MTDYLSGSIAMARLFTLNINGWVANLERIRGFWTGHSIIK